MVGNKQSYGFHKLSLHCGSFNYDNRLSRENGSTLRNTPHVAFEFEIAKIIQEFFGKTALAPEELNVIVGEAKVLHIVDKLLQSGEDGKAAVVGNTAEKHVKNRNSVFHTLFEVAVHHSKLVKIREHAQVSFVPVHNLHSFKEAGESFPPGIIHTSILALFAAFFNVKPALNRQKEVQSPIGRC